MESRGHSDVLHYFPEAAFEGGLERQGMDGLTAMMMWLWLVPQCLE